MSGEILHPHWLDALPTKKLAAAFAFENAPLRFVGGAVRDALLGIEAIEVDAATPLAPDAVIELLKNAKIKAVPTGIEHGTVTAVIDGTSFEITTLRKDVATDGRHAEVAFTDSWEEDAKRRDFTMNALYLSPKGELFDPLGGAADARSGIVKFIGEADARITEDYLRILRFFRFQARYGKGAADVTALAACSKYAAKISSLSGERIQQEMLKILAHKNACATLKLMQEYGVLAPAFGFEISDISPLNNLAGFEPIPASVRIALLLLPQKNAVEALAARWKISNALKHELQQLLTHSADISADTPLAKQKHFLRILGAEIFSKLVCIRVALEGKNWEKTAHEMLDLAVDWKAPIFPVTGADLIAKGFSEGKELGEKLRVLEDKWELSDYTLTKEALLKIL